MLSFTGLLNVLFDGSVSALATLGAVWIGQNWPANVKENA